MCSLAGQPAMVAVLVGGKRAWLTQRGETGVGGALLHGSLKFHPTNNHAGSVEPVTVMYKIRSFCVHHSH